MKYVLGYDLNNYVSQISYFELNSQVPESVSQGRDEEKIGIPTVLAKRKGVSQWDFGNTALEAVRVGNSSPVNNLLSIAASGAKIELEGEAYDATELLVLFVRRSLNLLSIVMDPVDVECMVITVESLEGRMMDILERIVSALPIDKEKIVIQTYEESIFYYMLHQPEDLWKYDVVVLDYSGNYLNIYEMWMNHRTTPVVTFVDRTELRDIRRPEEMMERELSEDKNAQLDEMFLDTVENFFRGKNIGTVFLIGDGFEGGWCDKTIKFLCRGKRVFQGRNMYSKGACYLGHDRVVECELNSKYVFLGRDKLKFNLGLRIIVRGNEEYIALADAGVNWFDSDRSYEFILGDTKEVNLVLTPLDGKNAEEITLVLKDIPDRPPRASRISLSVRFDSETRIVISARDMGFGEFYPSTDKVWEKIIELNKE